MENDPHSRNKDGDTNRQEQEEERLDEQQDHPNRMLRQEDEILRRDRNKFLIPPEGMTAAAGGQELRGLLAKAKAALLEAFKGTPGPESLNWLLTREARCSAAIESEFDEARIDLHYHALQRMLEQPAGTESLLECHQTMMEGQKHAQPGGYRTVNIQVGRHIAPEHRRVPELMAGLFRYLALTEDQPLVAAAWAHIQFETIHPFADGNGRTGRAIINQVLRSPLPLSVHILSEQETYYRLLDSGRWEEFLKWFLEGVIRQAEKIQGETQE